MATRFDCCRTTLRSVMLGLAIGHNRDSPIYIQLLCLLARPVLTIEESVDSERVF